MHKENFFPIETPYNSKDYEIMKSVVNKGIDSNLEAFTKSEFKKSPTWNNKFLWNIHISELPVLYRRLEEFYNENGDYDYLDFLEDVKNSATTFTPATSEEDLGEMIDPYDPMDANQTQDGEPSGNSDLKNDPGVMEDDKPELRETPVIDESYGDRYEQIVFLQGQEADEAMDILNNDGEEATLQYLQQWHMPGEHDGKNDLGHGTQDKTYEKDGYIMSWNPYLPYVGLVYDTEHNKENQAPTNKEEEKRLKTLKGFAIKFNVTPTGQSGKFSIKDFDKAAKQFTSEETFDFAMILANMYLMKKTGLDWDSLSDTNSMWDYIDQGMSATDILAAAQDAAKERLSGEDMGFDLEEDSQVMRHHTGQREKMRKGIPLGQHAPHSQAAINIKENEK